MSYVGDPFAHDLFVSYSHGSDAGGEAFLQRWSEAFAQELERELRTDPRVRGSLRVFLDKDLRPGRGVDPLEPLSGQLQGDVAASGILVVLMSDDYLRSRWCTDERDWWQSAQGPLGLSTNGRIALVRIMPTTEAWPPALLDARGAQLPGFKFHSDHPTAPRPLGWTDRSPAAPNGYAFGAEFANHLLDLAGRLYQHLNELKQRAEDLRRNREEARKLSQGGGQSIYLHGRSDRAAAWEKAGLHLTDNGFVVVPGSPDRVGADPERLHEVSERRIEAMSACDALLLVGTEDGLALDADLVVVGRHDRQSARARSHRLLPCGVLDTDDGGKLATPIRCASARNVQADWLDGKREPWAPQVREWLKQKATQAGPVP
ncbi:MAG TPA: toll/interleukin-1 receptor domain-containing protein [Burkholderiaceae bacterium]|nr:toll/interleukin-1 receptor domain-containing protein [Burkholderiaceae bacterium]